MTDTTQNFTSRCCPTCCDLGWVYDLPARLIYVYYGKLIAFGDVELQSVRDWTEGDVIRHIRLNERIKKKVEAAQDAINTYNELSKVIEDNKSLFRRYFIKEIQCGIENKGFCLKLLFEDFHHDCLFGYRNRTNCKYFEPNRLRKIIQKIIDGGEEAARDYEEWLRIEKLFKSNDIHIGWWKNFGIKNKKLTLKGNEWTRGGLSNQERALVNMCQKIPSKKRYPDYIMDYEGPEYMETLFGLLFVEG